ncbi:hypothetical protein M4I21_18335 [Cellulophaga sp. 20_2_10]|uniref:hypothetical protein n=1 Tax=Cellulophaga sp. 20_2_10 TaxID=2942476 RepID=UPI00201AF79F|nr:hypothetical protein [Cellulophaga sp. 20_2_10]MCL5247771.1 hypothetical protein [Cellulophaga sp. 20_2_10]
MKSTLLYFMLLIFGTSLGQNSQMDLETYFSESEIEDLNLITDFFQMELCGDANRSNFSSCIKNSIQELANWEQFYVQEKISWRKQKKMYSKISDSTFHKIWSLCKTWRTIEPKYEYKEICFGQNEKFAQFLNEIGQSNHYIKKYSDRLEGVGVFESGKFLVWNIIEHPENWNLEDRKEQMFLAIHFLTQNDKAKRDKKALRLERRDIRKMERNQKRKKKTVPNKA